MASSAKKPLKGILKQPKSTPSTAIPAPQESGRPIGEARNIAIQHATILEQKKLAEAEVLESIIRLLDFPLVRGNESSPSPSANPAPSDVAEFKSMVRTFQTSDYDDLIEERNTCGLCGYALCPRPRKKFDRGAGTWKLVNKGSTDFKIVERKELEKWCSEDCARRALYVKVQLNETAAWERVGIPDIRIELLGEDEMNRGTATGNGSRDADITPENRLAQDLGRLKLEESRRAAEESSALALERGDVKRRNGKTLFDFTVKEKTTITAPVAPSKEDQEDNDEGHLLLEGYRVC